MCTFIKINKNLEFIEKIINGLDLKISNSEEKFRFNISKDGNRLFSIKFIMKGKVINVLFITSKNNIEYFKKNEIFNFNALMNMLNMFSNEYVNLTVVQEGRYYEKLIL